MSPSWVFRPKVPTARPCQRGSPESTAATPCSLRRRSASPLGLTAPEATQRENFRGAKLWHEKLPPLVLGSANYKPGGGGGGKRDARPSDRPRRTVAVRRPQGHYRGEGEAPFHRSSAAPRRRHGQPAGAAEQGGRAIRHTRWCELQTRTEAPLWPPSSSKREPTASPRHLL